MTLCQPAIHGYRDAMFEKLHVRLRIDLVMYATGIRTAEAI